MNIAIIGPGNMGSGLGKIWARKGHKVTFSFSRHPEKLEELSKSIPGSSSATPEEAVRHSDVVLLSVKWGNVEEAIRQCGSLDGKVLIDCTNPLMPDLSGLSVGLNTSAAEEIQKLAKGAKVVKAFNTVFAEVYHSDSRRYGTRMATMLYCGDDEKAKKSAEQLIKDVGFEPVNAGSLTVARYLEPMAMLIINLGYTMGMGQNIALTLTRR